MRTNEIKHEIYEIKICYLMWFNVNFKCKTKNYSYDFQQYKTKSFFWWKYL